MHHIIAPVADFLMYERCIHTNPHLADASIQKHPCNNKKRNAHLSVLYNEFLDRLDPAEDGWLIFCHEDFEFLENPVPLLEKADKNSLYGVFGARIAENLRGEFFHEYVGEIFDADKQGRNPRILGTAFADGEVVDTVDCQCLMVHTATAREHNLRFDPALCFNLYVEDFCLAAFFDHGLQTRVMRVRCRHNSQADNVDDRPSFPPDLAVCEAKYKGKGRKAGICNIFNADDGPPVHGGVLLQEPAGKDGADIYQHAIDANDVNLPVVLVAGMMRPNATVLDVGCASGDNGIFLKRVLGASLWGLEYNPVSVERAKAGGAYNEVLPFDLDGFHLPDYSRFYRFFDYIFLGDVLEHITNPLRALKKLFALLAPSGSFLVSLPNVTHAAIIANMLQGDFQYHDYGILDATHLRFFTRKSMASLFADAGLAVVKAAATFHMPDESSAFFTPKPLFHAVRKILRSDRHFFTCQYVSELRPHAAPSFALAGHNLEQLDKAPDNNPQGWAAKKEARHNFMRAVQLSCGSTYPEELRRAVQSLWSKGRNMEAIHASRLFSADWYLRTYPGAVRRGQTPLEHYLTEGWRKGCNPSEHFDTQWYLNAYPAIAKADICPLLHYLGLGMNEGTPYNKHMAEINDEDTAAYTRYVTTELHRTDEKLFVPCATEPYKAEKDDPRLIAFYLPQFYPFPENDAWWGRGFTEWTNASKAVPQYPGHYQPHLPLEGFYDLRRGETVRRQIELARMYGIHGFCYYYYWFSGKKIMDMPVYRLLEEPDLDFPFCLCWANEPWSARWDGGTRELLIGQDTTMHVEQFFADILPLLADPRYIRVNGKPMLIIHRPLYFERGHFHGCMGKLRVLAEKNGLGGLHIVFAKSHTKPDYPPEDYNGEAFVEFPPHGISRPVIHKRICNPRFQGVVFDAKRVTADYKAAPQPKTLTYRTVFPMWDNTARRAEMHAWIFENTSPEWYRDWLTYALAATRKYNTPEHNFVFINAWNEWGEGAHLEPDRRYGFAFLEATGKALHASRDIQKILGK